MDRFARQASTCPVDKLAGCTLIGLGHIGSRIAIALGDMGIPELVMYDMDRVEDHNLPASFYQETQVGMLKAEALVHNLSLFNPRLRLSALAENYGIEQITTPMVVTALDSIEERERMWRKWQEKPEKFQANALIDVRVGANTIIAYCIKMNDERSIKEYEESFKRGTETLACSERAVAFNSYTAAGMVAGMYKSFCLEEECLPDRIEFDHRTWLYSRRPEVWE